MIMTQTDKGTFKHIQGKQLQICECWTCRNFEGENKWCGCRGIKVYYDSVKAGCEYFNKNDYCGDCEFFLMYGGCILYPADIFHIDDYACNKFIPTNKEIYV